MNTASFTNRASIVVAFSFAMALVGCGPTSSAFVSSTPTPTTSASSSATATASPVPSSSPSDAPTPQPTAGMLAGFTCADASGGSAHTRPDVVRVRIGQHDGYDRLVIEFSGQIPSYKVQRRSGTAFTTSPRGQTVTLRGTNGVLVVVHPILNWMSMMVASPNMPSVVCPRYAAHAAGDASAISDCAPLRLSRSRRHRAARHAGPVYHRGVPWAFDRGTVRAGALGAVSQPGSRADRGVARRRSGVDRLHQEHDLGPGPGGGGSRLGSR